MKSQYLQALAAIAMLPSAFAAPPGIMRWQTLASPISCTDGSSTPLNTIGFITQSGVTCASLADTDPTAFFLNYLLETPCSINLYDDDSCPSDSIVLTLSSPTDGANDCVEVTQGFRSLSVTC